MNSLIEWPYIGVQVATEWLGDNGGRVVTLLSPTSEIGVHFPAQPQVGKLVVAFHCSAVNNTEP